MAKIVVDPAEVSAQGKEFANKAAEVEALRGKADGLAKALASSWQGNRSQKFQGDWSAMAPALQKAMEALMQANIQVGDEELRNLALQRAERVKGFLLDKGLPADRLQVAAASPPDKAGPGSNLSRVEFALK